MVFQHKRNNKLMNTARALYSEDLPYHNFEHVLDTLRASETIIDHCLEEGLRVNPRIIFYALLFHDAGYKLDPSSFHVTTREEVAAKLAGKALYQHRVKRELILPTQEAILATHHDAPFTTNEQKVVRASDLVGLAGDYETFLANNRKLKAEAEFLARELIDEETWRLRTQEIVAHYLAQDIRLTSHHDDADGQSVFHRRTRANLRRYLAETIS